MVGICRVYLGWYMQGVPRVVYAGCTMVYIQGYLLPWYTHHPGYTPYIHLYLGPAHPAAHGGRQRSDDLLGSRRRKALGESLFSSLKSQRCERRRVLSAQSYPLPPGQ